MNFEYREIDKNPLTKEEVLTLAKQAQLNAVELINPRSRALKTMDVNTEALDEERAAELIAENFRVMHRPLLQKGQELILGFKEEAFSDFLT